MFSSKKIFQTSAKPSDPIDPGKIWYSRTGGANEPVSFANGHFYSAAKRSTDGKSWQNLNAPQWRFLTGTNAFYGEAVSHQNGVYRIWDAYSYDGLNWIEDRPIDVSSRESLDRYACHLVAGKFYATGEVRDDLICRVGCQKMVSSTGGISSWTENPTSFEGRGGNAAYTAISTTRLVTLNYTNTEFADINIFTPSTMQFQRIWPPNVGISGIVMGICHSPELNIFVLLTASNAYTSTDGTAWTARTLPIAGQWSQPAWNGTRFAAVHKAANIKLGIWSDDGITWNSTTDFRGSKPEITYLCGGNGNFVSGGGTYLTS